MAAFLADYSRFTGTGERNEKGETIEEFLLNYDSSKYKNPSVTADIMVFRTESPVSIVQAGLKLLMIKRKNHPCIGLWALPGGFIEISEDINEAARRELEEETGIKNLPMEQIYTWGEADRDPRDRIITVSYMSLVQEALEVTAGDDAKDAVWMDVFLTRTDKSQISENGRTRELEQYELKLVNNERGLELKSIVEVSNNAQGILREKEYRMLESGGVAFDHPKFIIQALLYIEELLKNK